MGVGVRQGAVLDYVSSQQSDSNAHNRDALCLNKGWLAHKRGFSRA